MTIYPSDSNPTVRLSLDPRRYVVTGSSFTTRLPSDNELLNITTDVGRLRAVLDKEQCPSLTDEQRASTAATIIAEQPTWDRFGGDSGKLWRAPDPDECVLNTLFPSYKPRTQSRKYVGTYSCSSVTQSGVSAFLKSVG